MNIDLDKSIDNILQFYYVLLINIDGRNFDVKDVKNLKTTSLEINLIEFLISSFINCIIFIKYSCCFFFFLQNCLEQLTYKNYYFHYYCYFLFIIIKIGNGN